MVVSLRKNQILSGVTVIRYKYNISTRRIAFAGVVAALYATLTITLSFIGYGPIQFRVAEALCILPFYFPITTWGLFIGCIIANVFSPYPLDIFVGPVASLIAVLITMQIGKSGPGGVWKKALACLPPVVVNAVIIGALIAYYMTESFEAGAFTAAFILNGLQVGLGQAVVMFALGLPAMIYLPKSRVYTKLSEY